MFVWCYKNNDIGKCPKIWFTANCEFSIIVHIFATGIALDLLQNGFIKQVKESIL